MGIWVVSTMRNIAAGTAPVQVVVDIVGIEDACEHEFSYSCTSYTSLGMMLAVSRTKLNTREKAKGAATTS